MTPGDLGMKAARCYHSCAPAGVESPQESGHELRSPRPGAGMVGGGRQPRPGAAPQYRLFLIFILVPYIMPCAFSACDCRCLGGTAR